ncbi:MAG: hypothetical protein HRU41_14710 [Saprospiraceae bacterium]|nr:hypothetical protein [Saprospiraceae bacterium]
MRYTVVDILLKLTQRERKIFAERILCLGGETTMAFYRSLVRQLDQGKGDIDKEALHQELFGAEKYNDQRVRKLMLGLKKHLEDFLLQQYVGKDSALRNYLLSHIYEERGAPKLFHKQIRQTKTLMEKENSPTFPLLPTWTKHLDYYHVFTSKLDTNQRLLTDLVSTYDYQFILRRLFYQIEYKVFGRAFTLEETDYTGLTESLLEHWAVYFSEKYPVFAWLWRLYQDLVKGRSQDLDLLQELEFYRNFRTELGLFERKMTIKLLLNLAKGHPQWRSQPFASLRLEIYRQAIQEGIFLHNGTLDEGQFLNIAVTAALAEEFQWMQQFIENQSQWLSEAKQADCQHLAKAYLYYHTGLQLMPKVEKEGYFKKAAKHISQVGDRDPRLALRVRSLSVRVHFEFIPREGPYFIREQLRRLRRYLRSRRLSDQLVESYLRFIYYTQKIAVYFWDGTGKSASVSALLDSLRQEPNVALRTWLIEKLEELISPPVDS